MTTLQIFGPLAGGSPSGVKRVVTERKGSWRWQDAYRVATYRPQMSTRGVWLWKSVERSGKIACTRSTVHLWALGTGSLHNRPARHGVDDFGNLFFVI